MGLFDFLLFWRKKPNKESVKVEKEKKEEVLEKQEAVAPEPEEVEVAPEPKPEVAEEPEEEPEEEVTVPTASDEDVYEVRTHSDGGWQVIKKDGDRARRKFDTQAECIEYCKQNELKYVVYKKDGTLR